MKTDDLIQAISADLSPRGMPLVAQLALALGFGLALSAAGFAMVLGPRPDIALAAHNPFFLTKFVVTLALAASALVLSLKATRPEWTGARRWLLLAAPALLMGAILAEAIQAPARPALDRLVGSNSRICLTAIPAMSVPILAAAFVVLRKGAPSRPALAGAIAGMMSAGLAATLYAAHCTDDSPLFVATWYTIATCGVAGVGALIGSRVLRY